MKVPGKLLCAATVFATAAGAPSPEAADYAKDYARLLTRVTEKPKMVGEDFSLSCSGYGYREYKAKFGPHFSTWVHYYRNDLAKGGAAGPLPVGSVIVKEKKVRERRADDFAFWPEEKDLKVRAVAGMIKRGAGKLPKSGDWEFFLFEDGYLKTAELESCAGCHSGARRDYVFTGLDGESNVKVAVRGVPSGTPELKVLKGAGK